MNTLNVLLGKTDIANRARLSELRLEERELEERIRIMNRPAYVDAREILATLRARELARRPERKVRTEFDLVESLGYRRVQTWITK